MLNRRTFLAGLAAGSACSSAAASADGGAWNAIASSYASIRQRIVYLGLDPLQTSRLLAYHSIMLDAAVGQIKENQGGAARLSRSLFEWLVNQIGYQTASGLRKLSSMLGHEYVQVGNWVLDRLSLDNARVKVQTQPACGSLLPICWTPQDNRPGLRPNWGNIARIMSASTAAVNHPPAFADKMFSVACDELREIHARASREDRTIAERWDLSIGTHTPVGEWNRILCDRLPEVARVDFGSALRRLSAAHVAMFDAGVNCWSVKYRWMYPRPWQILDTFTSHIKAPNHPSYPSGHSAFSFAAALVLDGKEAELLAKEASYSRVQGGIHFRFDVEVGETVGRQIGRAAEQTFVGSQKPLYLIVGASSLEGQ